MLTKLSLAKRIRKLCEAKAKEFSPHFNENLACVCAIASYCVTDVFHDSGFSANMINGKYITNTGETWRHCWVESEAEIFDITATQFDCGMNPKVLRTYIGDARYIEGFIVKLDQVYEIFKDWPRDQQPLNFNVDLILEEFYAARRKENKV